MGERERRIGENEVLFRAVNEQIEKLDQRFGGGARELHEFICECGHGDCVERVELTLHEYAELRSDATTFALVDGHEQPEVEDVVARHERFTVVRKRPGEPAEVARRNNP